MKDFLKELVQDSFWRVECFGGQVLIEGRILTPAEAERAGLASSLIAAQIVKDQRSTGAQNIQDIANKAQEGEDLSEQEQDQLIGFISSLRPEQLSAMTDQEDRILCEVVKRGSSDGGASWERLFLVTGIDQQNPETGALWVGMLSKEDRSTIMEAAMEGHKEAAQKAASFRK